MVQERQDCNIRETGFFMQMLTANSLRKILLSGTAIFERTRQESMERPMTNPQKNIVRQSMKSIKKGTQTT
ncbi:MAG: hypothetical protein ACJAWP_000464 [Porticoccus sp.]|jgi:hypothetical protein